MHHSTPPRHKTPNFKLVTRYPEVDAGRGPFPGMARARRVGVGVSTWEQQPLRQSRQDLRSEERR